MTRKHAPELVYVARESFTAEADGTEYVVEAGKTRVREGHPLLRTWRHLFKRLGFRHQIEQMTAAPGERRGERGSR